MSDFIEDFMSLTEHVISPEAFKLWSAITLVSGAAGRRLWLRTNRGPIYPSLYTLLIGPPGVGKGIIEDARELWSRAVKPGTLQPAFHVAPDSMTKAALVDSLAEAKVVFIPPKEAPLTYHSLLVASEEFSILVPAYDMEYIGTLNGIWNNKGLHEEKRRYGTNRELKIENPQLVMLAGTQPAYMASLFPEDAWNTGLSRRLLMVYSADIMQVDDFFLDIEDKSGIKNQLLSKLSHLSNLYGELPVSVEAQQELSEWNRNGRNPEPTHLKLQNYNNSRMLHVFKLATISALCRGELNIEIQDVERAKYWLISAEKHMPDVFRAMLGRSDKDVLSELHSYAMAEYYRTRSTPISGQNLRRFLIERVPHDKVDTLLRTADSAGLVQFLAGSFGQAHESWVPKPRQGGNDVNN